MSNELFGNKISNVIGVAVPQWLINQFNIRAQQNTRVVRDSDNVKYLANKTAWVRLVSSVNIGAREMNYFKKYGNIQDPSSLAKNFILFAGTSKYKKGEAPSDFGYELRAGLGESYGMLGEEEVNRFGYQPMPGITSVNIETMGRMGSVRSATINFRVFNKLQLDIADALYFKLGYTMFLEWANTYYYESPKEVELIKFLNPQNFEELKVASTEDLMIDPFQPGLIKEAINRQISENVNKSYGNYDGMLGVVTNFNYSRKEDGSYDCVVKLIGLGALAESIKINRADFFTQLLKDEIVPLVQNENAKIQAELDKQKADLQVKINEQKGIISNLEDQSKKLSTFNEIVANDFKIKESDFPQYNYYPSNVIDAKNADIVNETSWAIRKFSTILKQDSQISQFELDSQKIGQKINAIGAKNVIKNKKLGEFKFSDNRLYDYDVSYTVANTVRKYQLVVSTRTDYFSSVFNEGQSSGGVNLPNTSNNPNISNVFQQGKTANKLLADFVEETILSEDFFNNINIDKSKVKAQIDSKVKVPSIIDLTKSAQLLKSNDVLGAFAEAKKQVTQEEYYYSSILEHTPKVVVDLNWDEVSKYLSPKILSFLQSNPIFNYQSFGKRYEEIFSRISTKSLTIKITIRDSDLIKALAVDSNAAANSKELFEKVKQENSKKPEEEIKSLEEQAAKLSSGETLIKLEEAQKEESQKYASTLETILRTIQIRALNEIGETTTSVGVVDLTKSKNPQYSVLSEKIIKEKGLFSPIYDRLFVKGGPNLQDLDTLSGANKEQVLAFYAKYGFNNALLSGNYRKEDLPSMLFDHTELLKAYVIPHEVSQDFSSGIILNRPVHIKLGTLIMLLNHVSMIYDVDQTNEKQVTPLVYIDYNPNTNFCLSSPNHLSTNPIDIMIRYSGNLEEFKKLFEPEIIKEISSIFNPKNDDTISLDLPEFVGESSSNEQVYQGKIMNILIDIQYLLNTLKRFATTDGTNSVYLKSFLEAILSDISKYTGNYNIFRLAYSDSGNCLYVIDDQITPATTKEQVLHRTTPVNRTEIPLYGVTSIAKNLEIRTDISSKLANMLAISANSPSKQGVLSTDSTSFGFVNNNFTDRYVPLKDDSASTKKEDKASTDKKTDGNVDAAKAFNEAIKRFYGYVNMSADAIPAATNYYISKMSKVKSETSASRAAAMIPVSINFTTDGISGFNMYQSFTVDDELLPYTYSVGADEDDGQNSKKTNGLKKVGFCVVGLNHTIENNQWNTSVKANMIFLKDKTDYEREKIEFVRTSNKAIGSVASVSGAEIIGEVKQNVGEIKKTTKFVNFISIPGVKTKVEEIAKYLGVSASDMYIVFASESGFDSTIVNSIGATGLIQFMPRTATSLGTTGPQLKAMPVTEQLDYVKKYYEPYKGRVKDVYGLYLVTFFPAALGKQDSYIFQTKNISAEKISKQNPGIAKAAGKQPGQPLTLADFKIYVSKKIKQFSDIPT